MNILFISYGLSSTVGGTERVTRVLMDYLEDWGHHCFITYAVGNDETFPLNHKLRIDYRSSYHVFEKRMDAFTRQAHVDAIVNENVCELNVSKWLRKEKAMNPRLPMVYCLHNTPELFTRAAEKIVLQTLKNSLFKRITGLSIYMWKHKRMYDICDRYVVLSPSYISDFYRIFRLQDKGKVISIPNPISMQTDGYDKHKDNVFLVVARLSEKQKNISAILRMWKMFSVKHENYKLQIVGYGPDEQYLQDYAQSLGLQRVEFVGKTNQPQKYYTHAKFFLMTSRYEGLPMTIIESMQFDCIPIVYDSFSAIKDIIENGKNGMLIPEDDEQAFLQAMTTLVENEKQQVILVSNIQSSLQKFSLENIGKKWEQLLEGLSQ